VAQGGNQLPRRTPPAKDGGDGRHQDARRRGGLTAAYIDLDQPSATITLVRLHAGHDQLTRRILLRGQGRGSWPQPGDPLLAQSTERLLRIADQAAAQAGALERASIGAVSVDTDRRTVEEVADVIVAQTGWPGRAI
jgi:hypothetical protein